MSDVVTFYYNPMSRARMAHWMLEEVQAPYEIKLIDFGKREHKSPEFLKINPMGKLPAIKHKGVVITETPAICAYLADAFPKAGLAPKVDDPKRGSYLRWMFFTSACFEPAIIDRMLSRPLGDRPTALSYGSYEDTMKTTEEALTPGPFLCGDTFTTADLYLSSAIGFGQMTKSMVLTPTMQKYMDRCFDRPGHKRFMDKTKPYLPA